MSIRSAATLVVAREGDGDIEVLLLQRTWEAVFLPGFHVFPGGALEADDHALAGSEDVLSLPQCSGEEAGFRFGALRECFEEAGVLPGGAILGVDAVPPKPDPRWRSAVERGERSLVQWCREQALELALDELLYLGRWVTPPGPPRRFDTRFFLATACRDQTAEHDGVEAIEHCWITPEQALADYRNGHRLFVPPTVRTLRRLCGFDSLASLCRGVAGQSPDEVPTRAWPAVKNGQPVEVEPGEGPYDEVRFLDPEGEGVAAAQIRSGEWVELTPGIHRITAPNAGFMTGPGTNTYLVDGVDSAVVIDPGPHDPSHLDRVLAAAGSRLSAILVTHTHPDHSPGADYLREQSGAPVYGLPAPQGAHQQQDFRPDHCPSHNERIQAGHFELTTLYTPGHASNHLAFLLDEPRILFAGDLVMQGSTVVINPPDGDMKAYVESLQHLLEYELELIAPGHGFVLGYPHAVLDYLTTHRMAREQKVVAALAEQREAALESLTSWVYSDVPEAIHAVAARSLLAHLEKLEREGRVRRIDEGRWKML